MAMRLFASLACAFAIAWPCAAGAAMFKCVGKDGAISYQSDPCPETGNEKKMKEPPAGPTGSGKPGSPFKDGWTADGIKSMADGCVPNVVGPAKKDFESRAKQAGKSEQFPEAEITAGVRTMCNCFARRVGSTYARADFEANRQSILKQMNDEAKSGGACKPEGALGEAMGIR